MQSKKLKESGMVLITVVIIVSVLMILTVGLLNLNVSATLSNQHQIDRIKAEQFAKGAFWVGYMNKIVNDTDLDGTTLTTTLDGKALTANITSAGAGTGPYGTESFNVHVAY